MCYLLTIGTRESPAGVKAMLSGRALVVRKSQNASLRSMFPKTDQLFELTNGHCSCDLVVQGNRQTVEEKREELRRQYRKRRWSEAKITRALGDWESAHQRQMQSRAEPRKQLLSLLRGLAAGAEGLRVLVHFYSGQFDTEDIRVGGRIRVAVGQLVDVAVIPEDTLTEIVPEPG